MPNLVSMEATLGFIISPSLTTTESTFIAIFPPSTPAFIPTAPSSPMIGPGAKGVGPAFTQHH